MLHILYKSRAGERRQKLLSVLSKALVGLNKHQTDKKLNKYIQNYKYSVIISEITHVHLQGNGPQDVFN